MIIHLFHCKLLAILKISKHTSIAPNAQLVSLLRTGRMAKRTQQEASVSCQSLYVCTIEIGERERERERERVRVRESEREKKRER